MGSHVNKYRVAIIVSHPIQHFVHLYRALAKTEEIELLVVFASDIGVRSYYDKDMGVEISWKQDMTTGYSFVFLPEGKNIDHTSFFSVNNPSIKKTLDDFKPDVVQLHGYAQITLLRALLWCRSKKIPVLLWSDSSLLFQRSLAKKIIKKVFISPLIKQFNKVLTVGDNNESYYKYYGVKDVDIHRCPFTYDEDGYQEALLNKNKLRKELRKKYGISEDTYLLLSVGKLVPKKRPKDVLEALHKLKNKNEAYGKTAIFYAGDGLLTEPLRETAVELGVSAVFGGFINVDLLPSIYAMCDALVFLSDREPYGLAAREAICVGLPLVVSDQIGCVGPTDAARPNVNALVYPAGDVDALAQIIERLLGDKEFRESMSEQSLLTANDLSISKSVEGFISAVNAVMK